MEEKQAAWVRNTLERLEKKLEKVSVRSSEKIPYTAVNGVHDDWSGDARIGWWTNGFWGGIMWQLYALTEKERYRGIACSTERKLDRCLMNARFLDHDNGFRWMPTAVADYRMTGNPESRNRAILAADNLAGRFNHAGQFIRAWNDDPRREEDRRGWVIIDSMMNLPLLYWAGAETRDPRFYQTAVRHADTVRKHFVRSYGSVAHIVEFDIHTGSRLRSYGGQGYARGSSWTRGQAWGLYGFVLSFLHTKDQAYLETAERIAEYFLANIPESRLIPVDFRQPEDVRLEDSSAAAIASCGLIELSKIKGKEGGHYLEAALDMLRVLADSRCSWDETKDQLLEKCTEAYHDGKHEIPIIYGDYYFLEALMKLNGTEFPIWQADEHKEVNV